MLISERSGRQHLQDLPVTHALRRESGIEALVTYYYTDMGGEEPRWILAVKTDDGEGFLELGTLDFGDGSKHVGRAQFQRWLDVLKKNPGTPEEPKKVMRGRTADYRRARGEDQEEYEAALSAMYRHLRAVKGAVYADEYARAAGIPVRKQIIYG